LQHAEVPCWLSKRWKSFPIWPMLHPRCWSQHYQIVNEGKYIGGQRNGNRDFTKPCWSSKSADLIRETNRWAFFPLYLWNFALLWDICYDTIGKALIYHVITLKNGERCSKLWKKRKRDQPTRKSRHSLLERKTCQLITSIW